MEIKCKYEQLVDPSSLIPNPRNPNKHSDNQINLLIKLIKYQGFRHPIIVSKRSGFVAAGHGRLMAALKLGMTEVPVDFQDFENEAQEYQFIVSDNAIAELAELDKILIQQDVLEFGPEFDLEMLAIPGFSLDFGKSDLDEAESMVGDVDKKFILQVSFPNDMEMMDIHDDLVHRGYLVKVI